MYDKLCGLSDRLLLSLILSSYAIQVLLISQIFIYNWQVGLILSIQIHINKFASMFFIKLGRFSDRLFIERRLIHLFPGCSSISINFANISSVINMRIERGSRLITSCILNVCTCMWIVDSTLKVQAYFGKNACHVEKLSWEYS